MSPRIEDLRALAIADSDRVQETGSRKWTFAVVAAVALIATLAYAVVLLRGRQTPVAAPAGTPAATPVAAAVAEARGDGEIAAAGYVVATRRATVAAEITGRLAALLVKEGDSVRAGQLLAVIDARTVDADIASADAQLRFAKAQIEVLESGYANVSAQRDRAVALRAKGFMSEAGLLDAQAREASLRAQLAQAGANVEVSRTDNRRRLIERSRYQIRAPFAGTVTSRNAQIGEIISPISAGGGFTRTGVFTITDLNSLVIDVDVGERLVGRIRPGQPVRLQLDAFPNRDYRGSVIGVLPTVMRERAAVTVRVGFDGPTQNVLPDMAVRVTFLSSTK